MTAAQTVGQWIRIPALLALLWAKAPAVGAHYRGLATFQLREMRGPWVWISAVSMAFVVVMLVGRRRRHPWVVLAVEAAVAAIVAFVPPAYWVVWGGVGTWSTAMTSGFAQPLAVAWLGVVGLLAFHQLRGAPEAADASRSSPSRSAK